MTEKSNQQKNTLDENTLDENTLDENTLDENKLKIKNRGTGAGGANTNANGKKFEKDTILSKFYKTITNIKTDNGRLYDSINFIDDEFNNSFVHVEQKKFNNFMEDINGRNFKIIQASGCKNPDDVFVDYKNKRIYIIEKKFQQGSGSVDEKIQTGVYKKIHYQKLYPNFLIHYIYCLSKWFRHNSYNDVIDYLVDNDIPVFFNDTKDFDNDIVKYILTNSNKSNKSNKLDKNQKILKEICTDEVPIRHTILYKNKKLKRICEYDLKNNVLIYNGYKQKGIPYQSIGQYGNVINFNDASWFSYYSTSSSECAWKKWATHNNVVWSGITNVSIPDC